MENDHPFLFTSELDVGTSLSHLILTGGVGANTLDSIFSFSHHKPQTTTTTSSATAIEPLGSSVYLRQRDLLQKFSDENRIGARLCFPTRGNHASPLPLPAAALKTTKQYRGRGRRLRLRPRGLQAPGRVRQAQFPQSERRRPRQIRVRRFRQIEFPQVLRRCQDSVHLSEIETGEG
ncbi:hypothetical protein LINGRAHAP2_LOCUS3052 [Linum grandiflorum]